MSETPANTLQYRSDGPEDAPVLVLGPALGTTWHMWDRQVPELTRHWRVLRFDLPGHGGAPAEPAATVGDLADRLLATLDGLGVERFGYVGCCVSGAVGTDLALRHPHRLASLAVVGSAAHFAVADRWGPRAAEVRANGLEPVALSAPERWFTPAFGGAQPAIVDWAVQMVRTTDLHSYAAACEALAAFDARAELGRVGAPTLVIVGSDDQVTPAAEARVLVAGIHDARLAVVPAARHLTPVEQPAAVTDLLVRHFSAPWQPAPTPTGFGAPPPPSAGADAGPSPAAGVGPGAGPNLSVGTSPVAGPAPGAGTGPVAGAAATALVPGGADEVGDGVSVPQPAVVESSAATADAGEPGDGGPRPVPGFGPGPAVVPGAAPAPAPVPGPATAGVPSGPVSRENGNPYATPSPPPGAEAAASGHGTGTGTGPSTGTGTGTGAGTRTGSGTDTGSGPGADTGTSTGTGTGTITGVDTGPGTGAGIGTGPGAGTGPDTGAGTGLGTGIGIDTGTGAPPAAETDPYSAGLRIRAEVLGGEDRPRERTGFGAAYEDFVTRVTWGGTWARPGLDRRTRFLLTLTALTAGGHLDELAVHVRAALRAGVTADEIEETLLHAATYCGAPAAGAAIAVAGRVVAQEAPAS